MSAALDALAEACGILPGFRDLGGTMRPTSPDTQRALLRANGVAVDSEAMVAEALAAIRAEARARVHPREMVVVRGGAVTVPVDVPSDWHLVLEDAPGIMAEGRASGRIDLPPLPSGVHALTIGAETIRLIAAPPCCPSVEGMAGQPRVWGATAALYGLHSARNRGVGDFEDLARAAEALGAQGAAFLGINPVHGLGWADRETISPYSPSHRGFLNTAHIAVEGGAAQAGEFVDYAAHGSDHRARLEAEYEAFGGDGGFTAFLGARGEPLATFALYEAISEAHGPDWRMWPDPLRTRDPATLAEAADRHAPRIRFHAWLQWRADAQLADAQARAVGAGMGLGLYLDLAVGPRRSGAESWCEQGAAAAGVSLGAPPDHLSPDGQNWQLAAFAPAKLSAQDYRPLRRIIAEAMRHAGLLRIDHVLGLNRSHWIPDDGSPGGYIRQPFEALLAVIAIEAERAGTVVIGEDLGLVPEGFRETLGARGFYSYSVLQYEKDEAGAFRAPETLRPNSLVCFGTHDTPTLHGFCAGRDIEWWHRLGWIDAAEKAEAQKDRAQDCRALAALDPAADIGTAVHTAMAASPVAMVSVQLDDLYDRVEAQNLPGTIDEHPNWRRRCRVPVEHLRNDPALRALGQTMRAKGRCT